ncbi:MAG: TIGR02147 family protein [Chitinivibrionales bacterium]|nr:TIGR02147 family protein [Chitinivibrionales bacterium]
MPDIYEYTDHRLFLLDAYHKRKLEDPHFSHRYINSRLGSKSPSLFTHIIQGRMKISEKIVLRLAKTFGLNKRETEYFLLITKFTQATDEQEKRYRLQDISRFMHKNVKIIQPHKFEFYSRWYHSAIWALLTFFKFKNNFKSLARMVYPSITQSQAKSAIDLLAKLGFIRKGPKDFWEPEERCISTGDTANSVAISDFHIQTMDLARNAMDKVPRNERELSTMTISISEKSFKQVTDKIRECRQQILSIAREDTNPDRVYHINFHIFPMSKDT